MSKPFHVIATPDENGYMVTIPENPNVSARWADDHGMKERCRYTPDNTEDFFAFNASIQELLSEIYREGLLACVYNAFYQAMMPQYGADPAECYEARFYSYGLFGLLDEWIKRGFCETPEQMTALFHEMMLGKSEGGYG